MSCTPELRVLESSGALFQAAAVEFSSLAADTIRARGKFCVALSGGSTPRSLYSLLAERFQQSISWQKIYFFFGDERNAPPDHPDSNYRMAYEALLSKVPVSAENVFRIQAEKDAEVAAREYEQTLRSFFHLQASEFPRFDLVLLGIGPDGHAASLFPGSAALDEMHRLVVANWVDKFKTYRITLTFPVLNRARCVMFLASGADKASILHEVFENRNANLPSQRVCPAEGRLVWMVDSAAANLLPPGRPNSQGNGQ
jgi:6-phosphogluconolactonase